MYLRRLHEELVAAAVSTGSGFVFEPFRFPLPAFTETFAEPCGHGCLDFDVDAAVSCQSTRPTLRKATINIPGILYKPRLLVS